MSGLDSILLRYDRFTMLIITNQLSKSMNLLTTNIHELYYDYALVDVDDVAAGRVVSTGICHNGSRNDVIGL